MEGANTVTFKWTRHAFKALVHPLRVQVLDELREGPLNVTELPGRLGVERSTLSQQLAVLRACNLAMTERFGEATGCEVRAPSISLRSQA